VCGSTCFCATLRRLPRGPSQATPPWYDHRPTGGDQTTRLGEIFAPSGGKRLLHRGLPRKRLVPRREGRIPGRTHFGFSRYVGRPVGTCQHSPEKLQIPCRKGLRPGPGTNRAGSLRDPAPGWRAAGRQHQRVGAPTTTQPPGDAVGLSRPTQPAFSGAPVSGFLGAA